MTSWISHSGAPGWIIAMTDSDGLQCLSEFFPLSGGGGGDGVVFIIIVISS